MQPNFTVRCLFVQRLCAVGLMLGLCSFSLPAAAAAPALTGVLTDPQGRLIPNATIYLLRRADSFQRRSRTDLLGQFAFTGLDDGEYRLTAEPPGFAVLTRTCRAGDSMKFNTCAD